MKQFWGDVTISGEYSIVTFVTRVDSVCDGYINVKSTNSSRTVLCFEKYYSTYI